MSAPKMLSLVYTDVPTLRPFTVFDVEQRSPLWAALRAGLVTGSCVQAILAVRKKGTGELQIRTDLRHKILTERMTGLPVDRKFKQTDAMTHGVETEPDAIGAYEAATGLPVLRCGFIKHNTLQAGCSVDGYVGDWEGVIEAKCPDSTTHLDYLLAKVIPEAYVGQLVHAMWLTGAQWGDFVSFDPRFQAVPMQLFTKRIHRSDVDFVAYELALSLFLSEVERDLEALQHYAAELAGV